MNEIREKLLDEGHHPEWVEKVIELAFKYEGLMDLLEIWFEEDIEEEKINAINDIIDVVNDIENGFKIGGTL